MMEHIAEEYMNRIAPPNTTSKQMVNAIDHDEHQYLKLVRQILENGHWCNGRNGRTKSLFGNSMRFSLKDGTIPILTTKKTAWKTCLKELLWFIRGDTNNANLKAQGVHIWDGNTTRDFLNSRGLTSYPENIAGPIYGFQWRNFNGEYNVAESPLSVQRPEQCDQLQSIIDALKDPEQRSSRRLIMSAWNPCQLNQMALPPCHVMCQFYVHDENKLSCALYQRSGDFMLGVPFNIASYSFLTHLIAAHCGLVAYEFIHFIGDCHIYESHIDGAHGQLERMPYVFPKVSIKTTREKIEDYIVDDFCVSDYVHHPPIQFPLVV